ncbi:MAG: hypothetical protein QNJ72_33185 [Pleurocapsa sp. MO_226.B13]|nr:hypothetical protein [Pleurocapsa sp. MO_226.B13]
MDGWSKEDRSFYYLSLGGDCNDEAVLWGDRLGLIDAISKIESRPHPCKPRTNLNRTKSKYQQNYEAAKIGSDTEASIPSRAYSKNMEMRRIQVHEDLARIKQAFSKIKF